MTTRDSHNNNDNNNNSRSFEDDDDASVISFSIEEVLKILHRIKKNYTQNIDDALYYLHMFTHIPEVEVVDDISFRILNETVQATCDHIIRNYYPFCDDACELFLIQAQSWARYGTWYDYPQIFKYCRFAARCTPNSLQQTRIDKVETIAYNYKFKAQTESTIYHIAKTWFCYNTLLEIMDFVFPFVRRSAEYEEMARHAIGYTVDPVTGEVVRDLTSYLDTGSFPVELLTPAEAKRWQFIHEGASKHLANNQNGAAE